MVNKRERESESALLFIFVSKLGDESLFFVISLRAARLKVLYIFEQSRFSKSMQSSLLPSIVVPCLSIFVTLFAPRLFHLSFVQSI